MCYGQKHVNYRIWNELHTWLIHRATQNYSDRWVTMAGNYLKLSIISCYFMQFLNKLNLKSTIRYIIIYDQCTELGRLPSTWRDMNFNRFPTQVDCAQSFVFPTLARYVKRKTAWLPRSTLAEEMDDLSEKKSDFPILKALKGWIYNFFEFNGLVKQF